MSDKKKPPLKFINPTIETYIDALHLRKFYGGYVADNFSLNNKEEKPEERVCNMGVGELRDLPELEEVEDAYRKHLQEISFSEKAMRYSSTHGIQATNQAAAKRINNFLGVKRYDEKQVVSVDGAHNGIDLALRSCTSPLGSPKNHKQHILFGSPSYPYFSTIKAANLGLQNFLAYDSDMLAQGIELYGHEGVGAILINVPNNPMGYGLSQEQAKRISKVAETYDCAIVVDMVYSDYCPDANLGKNLALLDPNRTLFVDSFSKSFALPGLRLGFVTTQREELVSALRFVKMAQSLTPSNIKLSFAYKLLEEHAHIPKQIAFQLEKRKAQFLELFSAPKVEPLAKAGNHFYLTLDVEPIMNHTGMTEADIANFCLEKHRVKVFPGSWCFLNRKLPWDNFSEQGRPNPKQEPPYLPPSFPEGAELVASPDFEEKRKKFIRLSFGGEKDIAEASKRTSQALTELFKL